MLPSRGLRLSQQAYKSQLHRARPALALRDFSTHRPFDTTQASVRWRPQRKGPVHGTFRTASLGIVGLSSARFASTATTTSTPSVVDDASPTASTATTSISTSLPAADLAADSPPVVTSTSLDSLEFTTLGSANTTEHLGYLKELGLNHGWGPTAVMQWFYEHVHVLSGLPWWSSILLASLLYRVGVLAYPNLVTSDQVARLKTITPYLNPINKKMQQAHAKGDQMAMMQAQREAALLKSSAGVSFTKQFALIGLQSVLGYGTFKFMREMAQLPVPGLESQGVAWIQDLTVADPYLILPAALTVTMHVVFRMNGPAAGGSELMPPNADVAAMSGYMRAALLYAMPAAVGFFMLWMPACLQLSFASTSVLGMIQGRLMMKPWFREMTNLTPLESPPPPLFGKASTPGKDGSVIDVKKATGVRDLSTNAAMAGYQAPTVGDIARGVPSSPAAKKGIVGTLTRPFSLASQFVSKSVKGVRDAVSAQTGGKDKARRAFEQRARAHEQRRKRELDEDKLYREQMSREGRR